jgi:hypothetical protein
MWAVCGYLAPGNACGADRLIRGPGDLACTARHTRPIALGRDGGMVVHIDNVVATGHVDESAAYLYL